MVFAATNKSLVILGVSTGNFKYDKPAREFRNGTKTIAIHLAAVKPDLVSSIHEMQILTPATHVPAGEWNYISKDGYLRIINSEDITSVLVPDGDNADIPIAAVENAAYIYSNIDNNPEY